MQVPLCSFYDLAGTLESDLDLDCRKQEEVQGFLRVDAGLVWEMELRKHLDALARDSGWQSPLAVIAHIDLDAFYAQCQAVYAGIPPDKPLGCRQWNHLIAVNYPAREFGIKRSISAAEAKERCPDIYLPHVPVYAKGRREWIIPPMEAPNPSSDTHKVSLDLFRRESRKIFRIFRENFSIVEKAGIDEGFVNLGPEILKRLETLFPEVAGESESLPELPEDSNSRLKFTGQLPDICGGTCLIETWHDVLIAIGSELVADVRKKVYEQLSYNCSAGIGPNKLVAKLGSARHKPCNQTVVPQRLAPDFMNEHSLSDVWGWGGKLGKAIIEQLGLPETKQFEAIRKIPFHELKTKIDPAQAAALTRVAEGREQAEVSRRTVVKSLASVKNFGTHLATQSEVADWLIVYCSDLSGRLLDIEEDDGLILRPKVISVSYALPDGLHSKQQRTEVLASTPSNQLYEKLLAEVTKLVNGVLKLPARYLAVELSKMEKFVATTAFFTQEKMEEDSSTYRCERCGRQMEQDQRIEHEDYHFALSLQKEANSGSMGIQDQGAKVAKKKPPGKDKAKAKPVYGGQSIRKFFKSA